VVLLTNKCYLLGQFDTVVPSILLLMPPLPPLQVSMAENNGEVVYSNPSRSWDRGYGKAHTWSLSPASVALLLHMALKSMSA